MKVLVTGSEGFLGKNLLVHLRELHTVEIFEFHKNSKIDDLSSMISEVDIVFHLAGANRPTYENEFQITNVNLTKKIVDQLLALQEKGSVVPLIYTSSTQAGNGTPYGESKARAEAEVSRLQMGIIYRLPNVFGKWSRPNYNSVVATFCHNIAKNLPIEIHDSSAVVNLVYVDDVISHFLKWVNRDADQYIEGGTFEVNPVYKISLGELVDYLHTFKDGNKTLMVENVGHGFLRALHATYLSFLSPDQFSYSVPKYEDPRGVFVEMLKTKDSGQISFFTARPGITRGGHYHHTKTEKFLVIKGKARYRFRHVITDENYELYVDSGDDLRIIETIPGWSHDITNIGDEEMLVMLWANEIFNPKSPDTKVYEVSIEKA